MSRIFPVLENPLIPIWDLATVDVFLSYFSHTCCYETRIASSNHPDNLSDPSDNEWIIPPCMSSKIRSILLFDLRLDERQCGMIVLLSRSISIVVAPTSRLLSLYGIIGFFLGVTDIYQDTGFPDGGNPFNPQNGWTQNERNTVCGRSVEAGCY